MNRDRILNVTTRLLLPFCLMLLVAFIVRPQDSSDSRSIPHGDTTALLAEADSALSAGRLEEVYEILLAGLDTAGNEESVAILWRLSKAAFLRATRHKARYEAGERNPDGSRITKGDVIDSFGRGVRFGTRAVSLYETYGAGAEDAYLAYYWRGTNIGQQGNVRGLLASLFAIDEIRSDMEKAIALEPSFPDPHFVLCQMYTRVPGWSREAAVEYGRTALELHEERVRRGEDEWDPEFAIILSGALTALARGKRGRKDALLSEAVELLIECREHVRTDIRLDEETRSARLERIHAYLADAGRE